jgi:hypothetical protein
MVRRSKQQTYDLRSSSGARAHRWEESPSPSSQPDPLLESQFVISLLHDGSFDGRTPTRGVEQVSKRISFSCCVGLGFQYRQSLLVRFQGSEAGPILLPSRRHSIFVLLTRSGDDATCGRWCRHGQVTASSPPFLR